MAIAFCLINGTVLRPDGSAFANGEVTFSSTVAQVVSGTVIPASTVVATTDVNGNLNGGSGVNLIQGLALTVALSQNGNFSSQFTALVPNTSNATFANLATGVLSLNSLGIVTGSWTPTLATTGGTQPTVTYVSQIGSYALIAGTVVLAQFAVTWSATSGGTGGQIGVGNLPFPVLNNANVFWYGPVQINSFTFTAGFTYAIISPLPNSSFAATIQCGSGQVGAYFNASAAASSGTIDGTVMYRTV